MDYTSDEISAAVKKIIREGVRRTYGVLGNRNMSTVFADSYDAAAGVFLTSNEAPFYVVKLSSQRLRELVVVEQALLSDFISEVRALTRHVSPVTATSPVRNAAVALGNLDAAAAKRNDFFGSLLDSPAYQRFDANVSKFLRDSGKNIRQGGSIVSTPDAAKSSIPGYAAALRASHTVVADKVDYISGALDDYEAMNLPTTLSSNILASAKEVVEENATLLEDATVEERLGSLRAVVLDLLAARSIIKNFCSFSGPTMFALIDGVGGPYYDSSHPAMAAELEADLYGPYAIYTGNSELDFFLDGDTDITTTVSLQGSFVARADGGIAEPFIIDDGVNDYFNIDTTGYTRVNVALPATTMSAQSVANYINANVSLTSPSPPPLWAEPAFNYVKFSGSVTTAVSGPSATLTSINPYTDFSSTNIDIGDLVVVVGGLNDGVELTIDSIGTTTLECTVSVGSPSSTTGDETDEIEVGAPDRFVRIRISDGDEALALAANLAISLPDTGDVTKETLHTLGFYEGTSVVSRRTTVDELINGIDKSASSASSTATILEASKEFTALHYTGTGRTKTTSSLTYVLSKLYKKADLSGSGVSATFTVSGADTAGVEVGDIVVMREAAAVGEVDNYGVVDAVSNVSVTATMNSSFTATDDIIIEIGPALSIPNDTTLVLSGGTIVDGTYRVSFSGDFPNAIPFELPLETALPITTAGGIPIFSTASLGQERIVFNSTDTTLASSVRVNDGTTTGSPNSSTAYAEFFSPTPATGKTAVGTTRYFQLPEAPPDVTEGDTLELYETHYSTVSQSFELEAVDDLIITLVEAIASNAGSFTFTTTGATPPFARVRNAKKDTYDSFSSNLSNWSDAESSSYFSTLEGHITKALHTSSVSNVATLVAHLQALSSSLSILLTHIDAYTADNVPEVDALINGFLDNGADRAVDILLESRFSTFFGLDVEEVSYAGNVGKRIKEVQRKDIPIRKTSRPEVYGGSLMGETINTNFEFDHDDIEDVDINLPEVGGF